MNGVTTPEPHGASRLVHVGLLLAAEQDDDALTRYGDVREKLLHALAAQFPQFTWEIDFVHRRRFSPFGALDPLDLLEFAVQQKIEHRWDFALILVPNELTFRHRPTSWGAPASALEVGVISTATGGPPQAFGDVVAGRALHLLGHLWGLEHDDDGAMAPSRDRGTPRATRFSAHQQRAALDRLEEVADARIEEAPGRLKGALFYWRTFRADPHGILTDIWGYAPWKLPFRLGRLTAGAGTFVIVLLLTAETWEVGVNLAPGAIVIGAAAALLVSAAFLFVGQNLGKMSGASGWYEQLIRTELVIFGSLLIGMAALWIVLAAAALLVGAAMPTAVLGRWLAQPPDLPALWRYAAFMATLGLFGGALGGNLEDEGNFKARFLFDEDAC